MCEIDQFWHSEMLCKERRSFCLLAICFGLHNTGQHRILADRERVSIVILSLQFRRTGRPAGIGSTTSTRTATHGRAASVDRRPCPPTVSEVHFPRIMFIAYCEFGIGSN